MTDHLNSVVRNTEIDSNRPAVNYHKARSEEDPFPDPSILESVDTDQHGDIRTAVKKW